MKIISSIDEYNSVTKEEVVVIFVGKDTLEQITTTDLLSELESVIPKEHRLSDKVYLADFEYFQDVLLAQGIMGLPAIVDLSEGESLYCHECGDYEDFDGWNEDVLFDPSDLPDCLSEFLENIE